MLYPHNVPGHSRRAMPRGARRATLEELAREPLHDRLCAALLALLALLLARVSDEPQSADLFFSISISERAGWFAEGWP